MYSLHAMRRALPLSLYPISAEQIPMAINSCESGMTTVPLGMTLASAGDYTILLLQHIEPSPNLLRPRIIRNRCRPSRRYPLEICADRPATGCQRSGSINR